MTQGKIERYHRSLKNVRMQPCDSSESFEQLEQMYRHNPGLNRVL